MSASIPSGCTRRLSFSMPRRSVARTPGVSARRRLSNWLKRGSPKLRQDTTLEKNGRRQRNSEPPMLSDPDRFPSGGEMRRRNPVPNIRLPGPLRAARRAWTRIALGGALLAAGMAALAATTFAVPPLPPGPYPVACSNVTQDFSRLLPGEDVQAYWEGLSRARHAALCDRPPERCGEHAVGDRDRAERRRRVWVIRRAGRAGRRAGMPSDRGRRSAPRLRAAHRPDRAAHAAWRRRTAVAGRDEPLSGAAVFPRLRRQPDLQRLHRCAGRSCELRLCGRGAVSRRFPDFRPFAR